MTDSIQFVFSKQRLVVLGLCSSLIGLLLFAAGMATGMLLHPIGAESPRQLEAVPHEKAAPPAEHAAQPEAEVKSSAATSSSEDAGQGSQGGVAVDVASFPEKDRAASLASMLKREGFAPVHTGEYEAHGETLYYVRVGPFRDWDDASRVAQQLDQSFDLHTSLIPVKAAES